MRFLICFKVLGVLLMMFSVSMLTPLIVDAIYHEHMYLAFVAAFVITFITGFILWFPTRRVHYELRTRDGFFIVTLLWVVLSLFGSIPLYLNEFTSITLTDAVFESVSGLTTTGATALTNLHDLPRALLYYRQQLQFLGGMGIIVLAVAIMPMLGVGGMQLYRAEVVGPLKTSKLKPRIANTAKSLWYIYVGLIVACSLSFWACGLTFFDALGESFATVATGGFSLHESSFAFYQNKFVDVVAIFFMLLGSCNFTLHFYFLREKKVSRYFKDYEFLFFLKIVLFVSVFSFFYLAVIHHSFSSVHFLDVIFTVSSMASTTGFTTVDFNVWPSVLAYMLMFVAIVGGCGGSTSGGIKVIRALMIRAHGRREIKQLIHPNAVIPLKLGRNNLPESVFRSVWGFFSVYVVLLCVMLLLLLAMGMDIRSAFGALVVCLSNTGAAIGAGAAGFSYLHDAAKWVLVVAMFLGRLEIFTILVLFSASYWRR
jgi:trk system potassium uptake protein